MSIHRYNNTAAKSLALGLALVLLCNNTLDNKTGSSVQAQAIEQTPFEFAQMLGLRNQAVNFEQPEAVFGRGQRERRQISIPAGSPLSSPDANQQLQQQQQQQQQPQSGIFGLLRDQVAHARSLLHPNQQQDQQQSGLSGLSNLTTGLGAATLMSQLGDMVRNAQERQAQALEASRQNVQALGNQATSAAHNAQGGIHSALADIGAGLQRIAANNPNLLPDVKSLYQSVASKLSSASSSVAQAVSPSAAGQSQFANGVANQLANPQPISAPASG